MIFLKLKDKNVYFNFCIIIILLKMESIQAHEKLILIVKFHY